MQLEKFSFGVGDRFAHQGIAQLQAFVQARAEGIALVPVWNKSHREHTTIGTAPPSVRAEADAAVAALGWRGGYYVDADHINLGNVEGFLPCSDFFTIDVADAIGAPPDPADLEAFVRRCRAYEGELAVPGLEAPLRLTRPMIEAAAARFLAAVRQAGRIYRHIEARKGCGTFVTEVSIDETDAPQTPAELLIILAGLAEEKIPLATIAPKFTGRFNKGVDYAGDLAAFRREFEADIAVCGWAVGTLGLPAGLKLSVHSGSDKFAIYGPIRETLLKTGAGVHIKTAGTTWLEEMIGLAEAGGEGLAIAQEIYAAAVARQAALCAPYASVIEIDPARLPDPAAVACWSGAQYAATLRHDQSCPDYNSHFRQLIHVAYKLAAQMGERYRTALGTCREPIARNVTANLLDRHIRPLLSGLTP